jgi:outer membrane lipoprotein-sorting protein
MIPSTPVGATAEELVALLQQRGAAVRTMRAQFSVEATGGPIKGAQRMEAALIYQRPGSIRLQTFARMGFPFFDLVLVEDDYQIRFPMNGKLRKGRVAELDREGGQGGLGAPIMLAIQATLGNLNGSPVRPTDHVAVREEGGQYVLDVIPTGLDEAGARRLWFDRRSLEVVRQDFLGASGELTATIQFQDYRPVGPTAMGPLLRPYFVRAEDVRSQAKLVLTFHEIVPNPELTPQDWGITGREPATEPSVPGAHHP